VDARTDVYSLGVVLFQMLTGKKPFEADTPMAVVIKHINDPLPEPSRQAPGLSGQVEKVIFKAMAKQPENRFGDMGAFAAALERIASGRHQEPVHQDDLTQDEIEVPQRKRTISTSASIFAAVIIGIAILLAAVYVVWEINKPKEVLSEVTAATSTPQPENTPTQTPLIESSQTPTTTPMSSPTAVLSRVSPIDGMEMVYVQSGVFLMGSDDGSADEQPTHKVYLDPYWIDKTEVSNQMFADFLNDQADQASDGYWWLDEDDEGVQIIQKDSQWLPKSGYENHPAIQVTWYGARMYCQ